MTKRWQYSKKLSTKSEGAALVVFKSSALQMPKTVLVGVLSAKPLFPDKYKNAKSYATVAN